MQGCWLLLCLHYFTVPTGDANATMDTAVWDTVLEEATQWASSYEYVLPNSWWGSAKATCSPKSNLTKF